MAESSFAKHSRWEKAGTINYSDSADPITLDLSCNRAADETLKESAAKSRCMWNSNGYLKNVNIIWGFGTSRQVPLCPCCCVRAISQESSGEDVTLIDRRIRMPSVVRVPCPSFPATRLSRFNREGGAVVNEVKDSATLLKVVENIIERVCKKYKEQE